MEDVKSEVKKKLLKEIIGVAAALKKKSIKKAMGSEEEEAEPEMEIGVAVEEADPIEELLKKIKAAKGEDCEE